MAEIRVKFADSGKPIHVATNERHTIIIEFPRLVLRLAIDPDLPGHEGDRFILESSRPSAPAQIKTLRDDETPQNGALDLVFTNLRPGYAYSLYCEPGGGGERYAVFENVPFDELF